MILVARWGLVSLLVWLGVAWLAWHGLHPGDALVGGKTGGKEIVAAEFSWPDIAESAATLEGAILWGMKRDGQPLKAVLPAGATPPKPEAWRVVGVVVRPDERIALWQIDKKKPFVSKEGDVLANGWVVQKIQSNLVVWLDAEGKRHEYTITVE